MLTDCNGCFSFRDLYIFFISKHALYFDLNILLLKFDNLTCMEYSIPNWCPHKCCIWFVLQRFQPMFRQNWFSLKWSGLRKYYKRSIRCRFDDLFFFKKLGTVTNKSWCIIFKNIDLIILLHDSLTVWSNWFTCSL